MLILLSPAKSLDYESKFTCENFTIPHFAKETEKLALALKKISISEIEKMMGVSKKLAELNFERFKNFEKKFNLKNSRQALLAFDGDVYGEIDKANFSEKDFEFAQKHVRILSGFYGLLKPLDLIQPYRLEMGCELKKSTLAKNLSVKNLYEFWEDKIAEYLDEESEKFVVNLASEEYFAAVNPEKISKKVINISFKEKKGDFLKVIGINAKKARGMMTNFAVKNKISNPQELKDFTESKYRFDKKLSDEGNFVFIR